MYVGKPWFEQNWVYYNNTLTLALCVAGPLVGLHRWMNRYKAIQILGLCIKLVGMGIMISGDVATDSTAALVMAMILVGTGGAMSVVGTRVASQASVPHQDVALAISLLSLWSFIGSAIGSAIVVSIWSSKMPVLLREYLPPSTTPETIAALFGSPTLIRTEYDWGSPSREGAVRAYRRTLYYCCVVALSLAFIPLVAACFQTNYFLGKSHNAVTDLGPDGLVVEEKDGNMVSMPVPRNRKEKFLRFWVGR